MSRLRRLQRSLLCACVLLCARPARGLYDRPNGNSPPPSSDNWWNCYEFQVNAGNLAGQPYDVGPRRCSLIGYDGTYDGDAADVHRSCPNDCGKFGTGICKKCPVGKKLSGPDCPGFLINPASIELHAGNSIEHCCWESYCKTCGYGERGILDNPGCVLCDPGKYEPNLNVISTVCLDCVPGKYMQHYGADECRNCPGGKYTDLSRATSCFDCRKNERAAPGSTSCDPCALHYEQSADGASCVPCPAGMHRSDPAATACDTCPDYTFSKGEGKACAVCIGEIVMRNGLSVDCNKCANDEILNAQGKCEKQRRRRLIVENNDITTLKLDPEIPYDFIYCENDGQTCAQAGMAPGTYGRLPDGLFLTDEPANFNAHDSCDAHTCSSVTNHPRFREHCGPGTDEADPDVHIVRLQTQSFGQAVQWQRNSVITLHQQRDLFKWMAESEYFRELPVWYHASQDWQAWVDDNFRILRSGQCVNCETCGQGQYMHNCGPGTHPGECTTCAPDPPCGDDQYAFHPSPHACDNSVDGYYPTEPFQCRACELARGTSIVMSCGDRTSFSRWHPRAERHDAPPYLLKSVECDLAALDRTKPCDVGALYSDCEACMLDGEYIDLTSYINVMPYCPPGWRIRNEFLACTTLETSSVYKPECCAPCDRCEPERARQAAWQQCPGNTTADTQLCRFDQTCAPGEFRNTSDTGATTCSLCGACLA